MKIFAFDLPTDEDVIMGIVKTNFEVQVYDFLAHGITSDYDGVVGLDFLKEQKFCIDIVKSEVSIDI